MKRFVGLVSSAYSADAKNRVTSYYFKLQILNLLNQEKH